MRCESRVLNTSASLPKESEKNIGDDSHTCFPSSPSLLHSSPFFVPPWLRFYRHNRYIDDRRITVDYAKNPPTRHWRHEPGNADNTAEPSP